MMEAIRVRGRSGHSSDPSLGRNALEGMYQVLGELLAWRDELQQRHRNPAFNVPVPTLNLGHIHGRRQSTASAVPVNCTSTSVRCLAWTSMSCVAKWNAVYNNGCRQRSGTRCRAAVRRHAGHGDTGCAPIVQAAERLTGHSAEAVAFGTEGPYFNELGMQTLILGPGDIEQAHQPDEYLRMDRIAPTVDLLEKMIGEFCL